MSCERYWRDGILLAERGEYDAHRETCDDCRRAHDMREELIRALPEVAARATGDPQWQTRVWSRIAREEAARARRSYWISGGMVAACALVVVCVTWMARTSPRESAGMVTAKAEHEARLRALRGAEGSGNQTMTTHSQDGHRIPVLVAARTDDRPRLEIIKGKVPVRGAVSAAVHDRVQYAVPPRSEVRMYRADRLVLRCPAEQASPGCMPDAQGLVAEAELATAGEYHLVVISSVAVDPVGTLDGDLAAVVAAGGDYKLTDLSVR